MQARTKVGARVVAAVDPGMLGMERLAADWGAPRIKPDARSFRRALKEAAGDGPVVALVSTSRPELVAVAARAGVDRIAMYHVGKLTPTRLGAVALRAAFSWVDLTLVPDQTSLTEVVRAGADPHRVSKEADLFLERLVNEPRGLGRWGAVQESAVSVALDVAELTGMVRLAEKIAPNDGINVLSYHRILPPDELRTYGRPQMALAASLFEVQLDALSATRGFAPIASIDDRTAAGKVSITFDDGYEDTFRVALPMLQRVSAQACIFVVTGLIGRTEALWWDRVGYSLFAFWRAGAQEAIGPDLPDLARTLPDITTFSDARRTISEVLSILNDVTDEARARAVAAAEALVPELEEKRTMLNWEEIQTMKALGVFEIGSHTRNHICLDSVPPDVARSELIGGAEDLERHVAFAPGAPRYFALPRGQPGPFTEADLRNHGIVSVMTSETGIHQPGNGSLYVRRRDGYQLTLHGRHHPAKMRLELTGILDTVRKRRGHGDY